MRRVGLCAVAVLLGCAWGPPCAEAQPQPPPGPVSNLTFDPVDVETVSLPHTGGTSIAGGFYGSDGETCGSGTEAFIERRNADGSLAWRRCHVAAPEGRCHFLGGQPLFAGLTSIDPAHVVASRVYDADVGQNGDVALTGEVFTACEPGAGLVVSRAAVLMLLDAEGNVLSDAVVGDVPTCPPPEETTCCRDLCHDTWFPPADGGGGDGSCGGRAIRLSDAGVAFGGWCTAPGSPTDRDVAIGRFDRELERLWLFQGGLPRKDVATDVVMDSQGTVYATGFSVVDGRDRELFVSSHHPTTGQLLDAVMGGGGDDDSGQAISLDGNGDLVVEGYVTGQATLGGQVLGNPSNGRQGFSVVLSTSQLQPLQLQTLPGPDPGGRGPEAPHPGPLRAQAPEGPPGPPLAIPRKDGMPLEPPEQAFTIEDCVVLLGTTGGGCAEVLEESGDGSTLNLTALFDVDGTLAIDLGIYLLPVPWPFELTSFGLKVEADFCYTATLWLDGVLDDVDVLIGSKEVCPAERPGLYAEIPEDVSHLLGFSKTTTPPPGELLEARIRFDFGLNPCTPVPGLSCDSQAKDASVDEIEADVEF